MTKELAKRTLTREQIKKACQHVSRTFNRDEYFPKDGIQMQKCLVWLSGNIDRLLDLDEENQALNSATEYHKDCVDKLKKIEDIIYLCRREGK